MTFVTPLVKSFMFPSTFPEKFCTPPTTDAAKSAPGREARPPEPDDMDGRPGVEVCGMDDWR